MHHVRHFIANKVKKFGLVDTFGQFDGGTRIQTVSVALDDYRFSVVVENNIDELYFTEKLLDCFASMTIPIYLGGTNLERLFNTDGIIQINGVSDVENILEILNKCTYSWYIYSLDAIQDNFQRVQQYLVTEDFIYENYRHEINWII